MTTLYFKKRNSRPDCKNRNHTECTSHAKEEKLTTNPILNLQLDNTTITMQVHQSFVLRDLLLHAAASYHSPEKIASNSLQLNGISSNQLTFILKAATCLLIS